MLTPSCFPAGGLPACVCAENGLYVTRTARTITYA